jgi:hypothetical protein
MNFLFPNLAHQNKPNRTINIMIIRHNIGSEFLNPTQQIASPNKIANNIPFRFHHNAGL